ncbi:MULTISPECIES: cytochrome c biogenesis CcdA family protein [unclassified Gemella]|uniref:cytochrome c biogenesis CcdA family protein n=1 Tax=unclassified Gemella TaxID=2624949 RepID=UPI0027384CBB|nr:MULTISPECIES: cytochrome c biogenesis protein CcdA [unclassified Gemella]
MLLALSVAFLNIQIKIIQIISCILIISMGLIQIGLINFNFFKQEFSLKKRKFQKINPLVAIIMGFTFSFSWTSCIGSILASVFLYASSHTGLMGMIMILVHSLGFIPPFLIVTIFTTKILNILKKKTNILKYAVTISGIILILIGISILTGYFQNIVIRYFI